MIDVQVTPGTTLNGGAIYEGHLQSLMNDFVRADLGQAAILTGLGSIVR